MLQIFKLFIIATFSVITHFENEDKKELKRQIDKVRWQIKDNIDITHQSFLITRKIIREKRLAKERAQHALSEFNQLLKKARKSNEFWASSPIQITLHKIGELEPSESIDISQFSKFTSGGIEEVKVSVVLEGLKEGSNYAKKHVLIIEKNDPNWRVISMKTSWKCNKGMKIWYTTSPCE